MAKSDFCFTYYDGDAASDMQHMSRLERGAYVDLIHFQRKIKGPFTIDQARKFLSRDFDTVWPAMELILKTAPDGKFFIEWLMQSEEKAKKHSAHQSGNVKKRYQKSTEPLPINYQTPTKQTPLGDGDGDGNEDVIEKEEGVGETKPEEVGTPNGKRIIIRAKYAGQRPVVIHNLAQWFENTGQLPDLNMKGWNRFEGFMDDNPGKMFDDEDHLYNAFRRFHTENRIKQQQNSNGRHNTNSAEIIPTDKRYANKL